MVSSQRVSAVSFDFGQTLVSLDTTLLTVKLGRMGIALAEAALEASLTDAWRSYDAAISRGEGGHPWKPFMRSLLSGARDASNAGTSLTDDAITQAVDRLWEDQRRENLWRRPIAPMVDLCRDLHAAGIGCGVLSNSEGGLRELVDQVGMGSLFSVLGDSGILGIEKPDPRIFAWMASELATAPAEIVHIGDSFGADVVGAIDAGMQAIWFSPPEMGGRASAERLDVSWAAEICTRAEEVRAYIAARGWPSLGRC